eukprot:TRINITY_DN12478_c4_g5_i2.p1 TRINITY_DN12478_c4_g5~~TRINITY_DN12478_c4_g5_i2.p1  ORF type:complete len:424 (+),score=74.66 TRINITY_DN12478_c4_g5_i2:383-1654(+)
MEEFQKQYNKLTRHWQTCSCKSDPCAKHVGRAIIDNGIVVAHAVDLPPQHPEFIESTKAFEATGLKPMVVARIQNNRLARRYAMQAVELGEKNGFDRINEAAVQYHCTSCPDIDEIYRDGLDQRLAKEGFFGRGIYTSSSPVKSNKYWVPRQYSAYEIRYVLRCRVLAGRSLVMPDRTACTRLKREPPEYDSVQGNIDGFEELVSYNSDRVLVTHIVGYVDPTTWRVRLPASMLSQSLPVSAPREALIDQQRRLLERHQQHLQKRLQMNPKRQFEELAEKVLMYEHKLMQQKLADAQADAEAAAEAEAKRDALEADISFEEDAETDPVEDYVRRHAVKRVAATVARAGARPAKRPSLRMSAPTIRAPIVTVSSSMSTMVSSPEHQSTETTSSAALYPQQDLRVPSTIASLTAPGRLQSSTGLS